MRTKNINLCHKIALCSLVPRSLGIVGLLITLFIGTADAAAVTSRNQRPNAASRMPTMTTQIASSDTTESEPEQIVETETVTETYDDEPDEDFIIEDKTSQFDEILTDASTAPRDTAANSLAEKIRAQRAALDAADAATAATNKMSAALASGQNACDQNLRACMKEKCGNDYTKCAGDTDTLWGTKLDACRRDLPCNGTEYAAFSREIKADRDMNARIASYNAIINCGNSYNDCIVTECGPKFTNCLGKKYGDAAISKCEKLAKSCTEMDSGLASRMMNVFGTLRVDAEKQVQRDEERLYELRDAMRSACGRLGAMFDERTLDCVYTVNFIAGEDSTIYASKKTYAGSTFTCDQNWFGVDITTFKENAYRLTREQKSATSALLGSGVGMAVGAVTSGAIDRAIDTHKAKRAAKKAEKEHEENFGDGKDKKKKKNQGGDDESEETEESTDASTDNNSDETNSNDMDATKTDSEESSESKKSDDDNGTESDDNGNVATKDIKEKAEAGLNKKPEVKQMANPPKASTALPKQQQQAKKKAEAAAKKAEQKAKKEAKQAERKAKKEAKKNDKKS